MKSKETESTHAKVGWSKVNDQWSLQDEDHVLATLVEDGTKRATAMVDGIQYRLDTTGFWNPRIMLYQDDTQIVLLRHHFLGSSATIELHGEVAYKAHYRNAPLAKLSIVDNNEVEILSYGLDASTRPRVTLTVSNHPIPDREKKLLLVLGFFVYKGVMLENDDSHLILMLAAAGG